MAPEHGTLPRVGWLKDENYHFPSSVFQPLWETDNPVGGKRTASFTFYWFLRFATSQPKENRPEEDKPNATSEGPIPGTPATH